MANLGHEVEIQGVDAIARLMIMRVPHERRIGNHDGRIALIPKGGMVAQTGGWNGFAAVRDW